MTSRLQYAMSYDLVTQEELAKYLGIDQANISRLLNGKRKMSESLAKRIADYLKIDYRFLLDEDVPMRPNRINLIHPTKTVVPYIPPARPKIRIDDSAIRRRPLPRYSAK